MKTMNELFDIFYTDYLKIMDKHDTFGNGIKAGIKAIIPYINSSGLKPGDACRVRDYSTCDWYWAFYIGIKRDGKFITEDRDGEVNTWEYCESLKEDSKIDNACENENVKKMKDLLTDLPGWVVVPPVETLLNLIVKWIDGEEKIKEAYENYG